MKPYADRDTATRDYARRFTGEIGQWLLSVQNSTVVDFLSRGGVKTVLDVGGGHGQLIGPLEQAGCDVSIAGSSPDAFENVPERFLARCTTADLCALPFPDRSFDAVTCIRLLTHCTEWERLVSELCRVAARSVVVDYPPLLSSNVLYPIFFRLKKRLEGNTRPFALFPHHRIMRAFERAGFRCRERRGQFVFPMVIYRTMKNAALARALERPFIAAGLTKALGSPTLAVFERT